MSGKPGTPGSGMDTDTLVRHAKERYRSGATVKQLERSGFHLDVIRQAGYTASYFTAERYGLEDLRKAGFTVADLQHNGYSVEQFKAAHFPVTQFKTAGYEIGRMREGGYSIGELSMQGAWPSTDVEKAFSQEELDEDLELRSSADQVSIDEIAELRSRFVEASGDYFDHKTQKKGFKRLHKRRFHRSTLARVRTDLEKRQERLSGLKPTKKTQDKLKAVNDDLAHLKEIEDAKKKLTVDYESLKERLKKLIDKRCKSLKGQRKEVFKRLSPTLLRLKQARQGRYSELIGDNAHLVSQCYPISPYETQERQQAKLLYRNAIIGDVTAVDLSTISHPDSDATADAQRRGKPIEDIMVIDRKIELLTWSLQEMDAEVAALNEYRKILEQGTQVYSFIKSIDKWYWRLRKLAYSVTKVERSSQILKRVVSKNAQYRKQKRITGKRGFHIDFGCAVGPDAWAAAAQIGLSISLSGALAVDDDRRLRANVTLKLVPSFECKISGGGNDLFKFSAKLGFTITNQTYAFVDEHHFALYIAFRMANLLNFTDKFTKYGRASLHQHIGLYSDEVKSILEKIVGARNMAVLEWYLTKQPVVKAHFPTSKKWVPSADIGFSEAVLGLGAQASTSYKPQVFTKTRLEIPEKSKAATKEPTQAAKKFWEYTAYGDGHCLYYSLSFLLDHYGIGSPDDQALRGHAAAALRQLISDNQQKVASDRDPIWVIDTTKYPGGLDDLVQKTGHTSEYADLPAICALAHHFRMTIAVHRPTTHEVIELRAPRHLLDPNKYVDVIFRGGNHYNPLIPKSGAAAPQARPVPIRGATGATPVQVVAAPAEISSGYQKFSTKDGTGQKSELDRQTTRRAQRTEERAASPKLITATRSGYTFSGSGNISGSTWVKIKAELGYTRIWHNANPDNDGKYLNIKITNALFSRTVTNDPPPDPVFSSTDRQTIHDRYGDTAGTDPEKHLADAIPEGLVKDFFKSTFASVSDKFAELKCDLGAVSIDYNRSTRSLEWNLVRTYGTWRVQYMRWTYASSLDVAVDVPVFEGVSLTGGFGWSKMVALDERLGTHTLTYVITVFNGLKLRFDGRRQWNEFFEKHRYRFRDIFRRIGRSAERAENDERLATAYEETKDLSDLVKARHDWWKDQENDKWVHISDRGNATCRFLEDCKGGWSRLDLEWSSRHPTHGFRKITREASAELEMLFEKFTSLLWRATRCTAMLNARHAPWKEKYAYLVPAHGKIEFDVNSQRDEPFIAKPPYLYFESGKARTLAQLVGLEKRDKRSEFETVIPELYDTMVDLYKSPILADAKSVLAFYEHGFKVVLKIKLPKRKLEIEMRSPDGEYRLREAILKLAAEAAKKRKNNLNDFIHLAGLDNKLFVAFLPWIVDLQADKHQKKTGEWTEAAAEHWDKWADQPQAFENLLDGLKGPFVGYNDFFLELANQM